jgi:hypothetical protein
LQQQLKSQTDGILNRLGQFNNQYNQLFNQALHNLANYAKTYQKIVPDMQEILDLASNHQLGRKIANATDTALAVIMATAGLAGVGLTEDLLAASKAAEAKGLASVTSEVSAKPPLPPDGPLPPEWMPPEKPPTTVSGPPTTQLRPLPTGQQGQQALQNTMANYQPTQNKIYADTVNQMANDMANGNFNWGDIPPSQNIRIGPGNVIVDGHHRMVAAQMAADQTGRPLMGGIIPKGSVTYVDSTARQAQSWNIGVAPGAKPAATVIDQTADPGTQIIRDLFPLDDGS